MPCTQCKEGKYKWGKTGECEYASKEACESANHKYNKMRPTPLGKKTYAEYEKELKEFNLSKVERIDLSLSQDMSSLADSLFEDEREGRTLVSTGNSVVKEINNILSSKKDELDSLMSRTEKVMGDLRVNQNKANALESEATKAANELGLREDDIPGFDEMVSLAEDADETIGQLEDSLVAMDRIIMNL